MWPSPAFLAALCECARRQQVALLEAGLAAGHRVCQVVGQLDPLQGGRQGRRVQQVQAHDVRRGKAISQPTRVPAGQPHPVAPLQQSCGQAAPDVPAGTDHQDAHRRCRWGGFPIGRQGLAHGRAPSAHGTPRRFWKEIWRSWVIPVRKPASLMDR